MVNLNVYEPDVGRSPTSTLLIDIQPVSGGVSESLNTATSDLPLLSITIEVLLDESSCHPAGIFTSVIIYVIPSSTGTVIKEESAVVCPANIVTLMGFVTPTGK